MRKTHLMKTVKLAMTVCLVILLLEVYASFRSPHERIHIDSKGVKQDELLSDKNYMTERIERVNARFESAARSLENISNVHRVFNDTPGESKVDTVGNVVEVVNINTSLKDSFISLYMDNDNQTFDEVTEDDIIQIPPEDVTLDSAVNVTMTLEDRQAVFDRYFKPRKAQKGINCEKIIAGDAQEVNKAKEIMKTQERGEIKPEMYIRMMSCQIFKDARGYIDHPLSKMEEEFPLAFGIVMYKDVEQTERLLRAIYRPHNVYCIHIDTKTHLNQRRAVEAFAGCFDNIHVVKNSVDVQWGQFSVLEAELRCLEVVTKYKTWKYYINLTGQEFPLKTNREIVAILRGMDGANIVDGTWIRAKHKYFYRWTKAKRPPPHNIWPIKGSIHIAVNRHFVNFSLRDRRAHDLLDWLRNTSIPDETFFSSLNHNPHLGIKGSFLGDPEEYPLKPSFMRYKNWQIDHNTFVRPCSGKFVRNVCILGVGDLKRAYSDVGLFANKFHLDFEPLALGCLEEVLHEKTWDQFLQDETVDVSFYTHLDFVKLKLS